MVVHNPPFLKCFISYLFGFGKMWLSQLSKNQSHIPNPSHHCGTWRISRLTRRGPWFWARWTKAPRAPGCVSVYRGWNATQSWHEPWIPMKNNNIMESKPYFCRSPGGCYYLRRCTSFGIHQKGSFFRWRSYFLQLSYDFLFFRFWDLWN